MKKAILSISIILTFAAKVFSQAPAYEIYALRFASMKGATPTEFWSLNAPKTDSVKIDFVIWLIKGSNGKNILVDAGFLDDIHEAKEFNPVRHCLKSG